MAGETRVTRLQFDLVGDGINQLAGLQIRTAAASAELAKAKKEMAETQKAFISMGEAAKSDAGALNILASSAAKVTDAQAKLKAASNALKTTVSGGGFAQGASDLRGLGQGLENVGAKLPLVTKGMTDFLRPFMNDRLVMRGSGLFNSIADSLGGAGIAAMAAVGAFAAIAFAIEGAYSATVSLEKGAIAAQKALLIPSDTGARVDALARQMQGADEASNRLAVSMGLLAHDAFGGVVDFATGATMALDRLISKLDAATNSGDKLSGSALFGRAVDKTLSQFTLGASGALKGALGGVAAEGAGVGDTAAAFAADKIAQAAREKSGAAWMAQLRRDADAAAQAEAQAAAARTKAGVDALRSATEQASAAAKLALVDLGRALSAAADQMARDEAGEGYRLGLNTRGVGISDGGALSGVGSVGGTATAAQRREYLRVSAGGPSDAERDASRARTAAQATQAATALNGVSGALSGGGVSAVSGALALAGPIGSAVGAGLNLAMHGNKMLNGLLKGINEIAEKLPEKLVKLIPRLVEELVPALLKAGWELLKELPQAIAAALGKLISDIFHPNKNKKWEDRSDFYKFTHSEQAMAHHFAQRDRDRRHDAAIVNSTLDARNARAMAAENAPASAQRGVEVHFHGPGWKQSDVDEIARQLNRANGTRGRLALGAR